MVAATFFVSLVGSLISVPILIIRLRKAGIVGEDIHKHRRPLVPEMGGLAVVAGFVAGILFSVAVVSFFHGFPEAKLPVLLAVLTTVLLAGLIGLIDDLLGMRQSLKALLPVFAALPLMAVRAGHTWMWIPWVGRINLWIFYPLLVVPAGVTIAANAVNMLAGFNGVEIGLGMVAIGSLTVIATALHETTAALILLSGLGALLGIIYFNWYPAKILVGDIGTLSIGAIVAAAVIVGNFEVAGLILLIPYAVDFLFKAVHGFPKSFGELRHGKLHCPPGGPVGLGQFIMKLAGGIGERTLALLLIGIEAAFGLLAIALYLWI
jgi:UDP-N-acetylglucosamine--dolichyl-phosphate N-acetylglucosaminephosphotransferase